MKRTERISVGVAGAGYIANFAHLPILSNSRDVDLKAICDIDLRKAHSAAQRFRIPQVYESLTEMLSNDSFDLVDICLPPASHYDAIMKVLDHGVNCLVEKPLTVKTTDADAVISYADRKRLKIYVIHNYSALPAVLKAKKLVAEGAIGRVRGAHVNHLNVFMDRHLNGQHWVHSLAGDYFAEVGPHLAMLLVEFIGSVDEAFVIAIKTSNYDSIKLDEYGIVARSNGAVGTISCSENCPSRVLTIDIWGTEGCLQVNADYQAVVRRGSLNSSMNTWGRGRAAVNDIYSRCIALLSTSLRVLTGRYSAETVGHCYLIAQAIKDMKGEGHYPIQTRDAREAVRLLELVFGGRSISARNSSSPSNSGE
jgi:predicted dehydrogenase